jgi:hypothetical protein
LSPSALVDVQAAITQTRETTRITPLSETVATVKPPALRGTPIRLLAMAVSVGKHIGSKINVVAELLRGQTPQSQAVLEVALAAQL